MARRYIAWGRLGLLVSFFGPALAAILWNWHTEPPLSLALGASINGRNAPGDLTRELQVLGVELLTALAAMQPWTPWPRRRWIGLAGLLFGAWGLLLFIAGLHSPPVALPNMLLMLMLGVVLCCSTLAFQRREDAINSAAVVTNTTD